MTTEVRTIGFIGAGNMPQSIIGGMVKGGYPADKIIASNPSRPKLDKLESECGIATTQDNHEVIAKADVIVLSVKPQLMSDVCADLKSNCEGISEKLFVTIAAGIRIEKYKQYLGDSTTMIRVMPNTPSLVGEGVSGLVADSSATDADKDFITQVFDYVGLTIWMDEEDKIDVLGAVAGSGPAYFFEFMHGLQQAAESLGFPADKARAWFSKLHWVLPKWPATATFHWLSCVNRSQAKVAQQRKASKSIRNLNWTRFPTKRFVQQSPATRKWRNYSDSGKFGVRLILYICRMFLIFSVSLSRNMSRKPE